MRLNKGSYFGGALTAQWQGDMTRAGSAWSWASLPQWSSPSKRTAAVIPYSTVAHRVPPKQRAWIGIATCGLRAWGTRDEKRRMA